MWYNGSMKILKENEEIKNRTSYDIGKDFEDEIKSLLNKLGFQDIKGGQDFKIKGNQIDVAARLDDVLFIFECKASGRELEQEKDFRKDIKEFMATSNIVYDNKNYKDIDEYNLCKNCKFIFITKKIKITQPNEKLCRENHIWYRDYSFVEYYKELTDKIGEDARYSFLSEFKVFSKYEDVNFKTKAIKNTINNYEVYTFFADPKKIIPLSYVANRNDKGDDFYQRLLDGNRIRKISQFVNGGGIFPTNIILSIKEDSFVSFDEQSDDGEYSNLNNQSFGVLCVGGAHDTFHVIDGQHRLYSFSKTNKETPILFTVFRKLEPEKERKFFLEINREQKPVSPDLVWDLEGRSATEYTKTNIATENQLIAVIVRSIYKVNDSHFFHNIYIPSKNNNKKLNIKISAFCSAIKNSNITKNTISDNHNNPMYNNQNQITFINNTVRYLITYTNIIKKEVLRDCKKPEFGNNIIDFIFGNQGIHITLKLYEYILAHIHKKPDTSNLNQYVYSITDYLKDKINTEEDLEKIENSIASSKGKRSLINEIVLYVRKNKKILYNERFGPSDIENYDIIEEIKGIERGIGKLIDDKLSTYGKEWYKDETYVSKALYESIYKIRKQDILDGLEFHNCLGLEQEKDIIMKNYDNIFINIFEKYPSIKNLESDWVYLKEIRNLNSHNKTEDIKHNELHLEECKRVIKYLNQVLLENDISDESEYVEDEL